MVFYCSTAQALEINNGATFTNNQQVQLALNIPPNCYEVQIQNETEDTISFNPSSSLSWTLLPGDGQKTVNVTYLFTVPYTYQCGTYPCGTYCCDYSWGRCVSYCTNYCPRYCQGVNYFNSVESANIILDQTPPIFAVDSILDPTPRTSQTIDGTIEKGSTVTAECLNAIIDSTCYTSDTAWSIQVSNLSVGSNTIKIIAQDEVGNESIEEISAIIFIPFRGDFNIDENVDMTDAILCMQTLSKSPTSEPVFWESGINEDKCIGMDDIIFIMQKLVNPQ
jgi:hypothetical protein